ncbi:MAG: PrsW family glutamic-type intramembrane protease [Ktedonobacterales bacterium]
MSEVSQQARSRTSGEIQAGSAMESLAVLRIIDDDAEAGLSFLGGMWACPVTGDVTGIGRSLRNGAVLLDPAVSREHALLLRAPDEWRIENISTHNPLWVGDHEVAPGGGAAMPLGETLRLGDTRLQLLAPIREPEDGATSESAQYDQLGGSTEPAHGKIAPAQETSGTRVLAPGVTLQFALAGLRNRRRWWIAVTVACMAVVMCAIITIGTAALVGHDALVSGGATQVLAALTIPLVPALGVSLLVSFIDRYEREPWLLLLAAFFWGAIIAIPPVLLIERTLNATLIAQFGGVDLAGGLAHAAMQALSAGVTEELLKGAGLLLLLLALRDEFDNVTDGIIYGLLIGAGFAMVENFIYFALSPRDELQFLLLGRIALGWLSHSTFTALIGAGFGYARETVERRRRWRWPLIGLLTAIALHTFFDFVAFAAHFVVTQAIVQPQQVRLLALGTLLLSYGPLFAAQAVVLRIAFASLEREAAIVRAYLAPEVLAGVAMPDEYLLVQDAHLRSRAEWRFLLEYGMRTYLTARALHQTLTGLAFRHWHVAMGDPAKAGERQPEEVYRARIARLRRSLLRQT